MRELDWDEKQLEVILADSSERQLVIAGPGEGKTAVACGRIAFLIDDGLPASRILILSFTRTAVAEIRDRIIGYTSNKADAQTVKISTLDSQAWRLRYGFDKEALISQVGESSYDLSIEKTIDLFREKNAQLLDFMHKLEHVLIDEAQDIVGARATLVVEILRSLDDRCGVTIFADPAQSIFGFTTEEGDTVQESLALLSALHNGGLPPFQQRTLGVIYRIQNKELRGLFHKCREKIESPECAADHIADVRKTICENCGNHLGLNQIEEIADRISGLGNENALVLFRRRADLLMASSFCSSKGVQHRLRLSGTPVVVRPWIGALFHRVTSTNISRAQFDELWAQQSSETPEAFEAEDKEECWSHLHRFTAARRPNAIDLAQVRLLVARQRLPIELCYQEFGWHGPILGTIHASKGREAQDVLLLAPTTYPSSSSSSTDYVFEEGRVLYVGATRARDKLLVAENSPCQTSYLASGRAYRFVGPKRFQFEIGREGDVDLKAHFNWDSAERVHKILGHSVGTTAELFGEARADWSFMTRLFLKTLVDGVTRVQEIGQLSQRYQQDLKELWSIVGRNAGHVKPAPKVHHLYLFGVTTVALSDTERMELSMPTRQSGIGLAPLIKGFSVIPFIHYTPGR